MGMSRGREDVVDGPVLADPAGLDDHCPPSDGPGYGKVVAYEDDRRREGRGELGDELEDRCLHGHVQRRCDFVAEQELGPR